MASPDKDSKIGAQPDWLVSAGAWALENGHRLLLTLTGGRFPKSLLGMKPVELEAIGRKSGVARKTLLSTPIHDENRVILVASKGGHQEDPQWYKNLVANPEVTILIDDEVIPVRARTAEGDERAELWSQITSKFKNYAGYQRNTDRQIPVVVCERITPAA